MWQSRPAAWDCYECVPILPRCGLFLSLFFTCLTHWVLGAGAHPRFKKCKNGFVIRLSSQPASHVTVLFHYDSANGETPPPTPLPWTFLALVTPARWCVFPCGHIHAFTAHEGLEICVPRS